MRWPGAKAWSERKRVDVPSPTDLIHEIREKRDNKVKKTRSHLRYEALLRPLILYSG